MAIERTTIEEMRCSMGGCSNTVRDLGMREGEGVYTIEEIAIDAGWKIEEFNGGVIHVCPRCSSDYDALRAELARVKAESLRVVVDGEAGDMGEITEPYIFKHENEIWRSIGGVGIVTCVSIDGSRSIRVSRHTIVQPVRLERWEDE